MNDATHMTDPSQHPFATNYSDGFDELLRSAGISLALTTYQAGRLVLLRPHPGTLNTHYVPFNRPTGLAVSPTAWALGAGVEIRTFGLSQAALTDCPPGTDRVFAERHRHTTGAIDVHDMAFGQEGLWAVNTRFNALCTLDSVHSFVPRWRPKFISQWVAEDRCHLNGLALRDGQPAHVTALGTTDVLNGWREHKASGGVVMDVASGEVVVGGLCMPHSPRWYGGRLWVLESGRGGFGYVDLQSGRVETIASLPGFTRGLAFHGSLAFVGLSQVRETAIFGELPITEGDQSRHCGVWVIDVSRGEVVGAVAFTGSVNELFAVEVIHDSLSPEVMVGDSHNESLKRTFVLPKTLA
jgi:uncharacterized protein (TIGR03032 family)